MKVTLARATIEDVKELHAMQVKAFKELLVKYQDFDTSPANESLEKVKARMKQDFTFFYFICVGQQKAGAIRIIDEKIQGKNKRISPVFILPEFQGKGIAQKAIRLCEEIHGDGNWELDTILQEPKNCHLYEKMGYVRTGKTKAINERLTLVFYEKKEAGMCITVREETKDDFREGEVLTRKAFWNVYVPGCYEHYLAHILRSHKDFIPELDLVAETKNGKIVGNVMYTKAKLTDESGMELPILTFGPISVHPDDQRRGISRKLLEFSFEKAVGLGYKAIVIFGNPGNYVSRGFKSCKKYNLCTEDGSYPTAMLAKELVTGTFDGRKWFYHESPAYSFEKSDAEKFDRQFEPMKKEYRPSQEEFYIYSHSVIQD